MPYVKNAVTSLAQGVSQQAESQRHPSQAAEQINAYSSHVKGLVKRPPTKHIGDLNVHAGTGGNSFVHVINRDAVEQYAVIVNKGIRLEVTPGLTSDFLYYNHASAAQFANGDKVQFFRDTDSVLPFGILSGKFYYVISHALVSGTQYKFEVSKTSGGAEILLGKVELTESELGGSADSLYKAGLLIESVRIVNASGHDDGEWIDGVMTVRFSDVTSGSGHHFEEGDEILINNLTGTTGYIIQAGRKYEVTQKGTDGNQIKQMMGSALTSAGDSNEVNNKFWLKGYSEGAYGFFRDRDQLPAQDASTGRTPDERVGWFSVTSADKWVANDDKIYRIAVDGSNPLDYTSLANGQLMKIGTGRRNPRGIKIAHGTGNITHTNQAGTTTTYNGVPFIQFAEGVGISTSGGMAYDDTAAKTVQLYYWASLLYSDSAVGISNGTQRRPLPTDYRSAMTGVNEANKDNWAYVGTDGTPFFVEGGTTGTGPHVHDLQTGVEYPIDFEDHNTSNALEYLLDVSDPATQLKAATVGDTTFLLNTTVASRSINHEPNQKKYEAFISIDSADYGKEYTINIGNEAVHGAVLHGTTPKKARCYLHGAKTKSHETRKIAMIRARKAGTGFNGVDFRLVQNFKVQRGWKAWDQKGGFKLKNPSGYWSDISAKATSNSSWVVAIDTTDDMVSSENGTVAILPRGKKGATLIIDFHWAKGRDSNTTSVEELMRLFNSSPLGDDWEFLTCDADGQGTGDVADDVGLNVSADADLTSLTSEYIFHKGELHSQNPSTKTARGEYNVGIDALLTHVPDHYKHPEGRPSHAALQELNKGHFWSLGYRSPSMVDNYTNRSQMATGKGYGAIETSSIGNRVVYDGQFFYRTPKWTGNAAAAGIVIDDPKTQRAIGTVRIAEMLASNARIDNGTYSSGSTTKKADGKTVTDGNYAPEHEEECIGLNAHDQTIGRLSNTNHDTWIDNAGEDWIVAQDGNIISIRHPKGKFFDVSVTDDMGGNAMSLCYTEVSESVKLPNRCRHGHVVKVVGDAREEADDYYLKFEADGPDPDISRILEGRWVETVGHNMRDQLDPYSMPVILVRKFSDEFVTASNPDGKNFVLTKSPWLKRNAGDDLTNPFPSVLGSRINDVFLHKNRLGLIGGESVVLSEAGEHYNLFRTTTAALLDTAPIDVTASTNMVSHLKHAIPFADQLIVFSEQAQFSITADPYLSPKTVQITATSHFSNSASAKPVNAGGNIFFAFKRSNFGAVSEYFKSRDQSEAMESKDISAHIPKYISGNILSVTSCPEENTLVCLTDDATQAIIYVYKYFTASDGSKTQSAWFKYVFGGENDRVLACKFIHNILYLVIKRDTVVGLESLVFEDSQKDTDMDYEVLLDRRLDVIWNGSAHVLPTGVTLGDPLYDANTGKSTVTLSYVPETAARVQVVRADGKTVVASDLTGAVAKFPIDLTGVSFYIGDPYTLEYTFSKPHLRKNTGSGGRGTLMGGRQQLTRGTLEFTNSRQFKVTVTHIPENTVVSSDYSFTGVELGFASGIIGADTLSEGFYSFGIMGRNDRVSIKLTNSTPYPSDFLSLDYEGRAYARGNRWTG